MYNGKWLFSETNGHLRLMSQIIKSNYIQEHQYLTFTIASTFLESNTILHFQNLVCFEYTATNNK